MNAPRNTAETPVPVGRVNDMVRGWVGRLGAIWVTGQVIENRAGRHRHFLTLRDPRAEASMSVSATRVVMAAEGPIEVNSTVVALLTPEFWTGKGTLTFQCHEIRPEGEGRLLARIEQLRQALAAEGLFSPARKRRLPFLPRRVGLITAADSAAERDVVTIARDRWPGVEFEVCHPSMQGPRCVEEVVADLQRLQHADAVDVIVLARGGGSLEDLLPFSDERVVRAVAAATTPVVSAIGHETDTPLVDHAADVRAATPTDAARRVVPDAAAERASIETARHRLDQQVRRRIEHERSRVAALRSRPCLTDPLFAFSRQHEVLAGLRERNARAVGVHLRHSRAEVESLLARARSLSPRATLRRGYAIVVDDGGKGVTSVGTVRRDDALRVRLFDGDLAVRVTATHPGTTPPTETDHATSQPTDPSETDHADT